MTRAQEYREDLLFFGPLLGKLQHLNGVYTLFVCISINGLRVKYIYCSEFACVLEYMYVCCCVVCARVCTHKKAYLRLCMYAC